MKKILKIIIISLIFISIPFGIPANAYTHSLVIGNTEILPATQNNVNGAYIYAKAYNQIISLYLPVDASLLNSERFSVYLGVKDFVSKYAPNGPVYINLQFIDSNGKEYTFSPKSEPDKFYSGSVGRLTFSDKSNYPTDYCGLISFSPHSFTNSSGVSAVGKDIKYLKISAESQRGSEQKLFIGNVYYQNNNTLSEAYNIYNTAQFEISKYTVDSTAIPSTTAKINITEERTATIRTTAEKTSKTTKATKAAKASKTTKAKNSAEIYTPTTIAKGTSTEYSQADKSVETCKPSTIPTHNVHPDNGNKTSSVIVASCTAAVIAVTFAIAYASSNSGKAKSKTDDVEITAVEEKKSSSKPKKGENDE